ncbi:MAG TPA: hydrogen-dependent growth transcriptional repressor [Desulfuromonadales bacterium]|nr:hydrogen-dependent growth transcriptional repressor [Desulfuromonadales bacterium]
MPRHVENPKSHIVSCRLNEEELHVLQKIAESKKTNISDLLRQSLGLLDKDSLNRHLLRFS